MKTAALTLAVLGLAGPAVAQERTITMKNIIGASPEAVGERLGLTSPADWAPRLIAWHDGKRFELLRPQTFARPSFCEWYARYALPGPQRHFDSFLFIDGVLVSAIGSGEGLQKRQEGPEDSVRFEEGVGSFLTDITAQSLGDEAAVTATCIAKLKVDRPEPNSADIALGIVARVWYSPLTAVGLVEKARRRAMAKRAPAIMARLQVGAVLGEGPEAFARRHKDQVEWHPSVYTEGYGVLTVNLGEPSGPQSEPRIPDFQSSSVAKLGVRNGQVEWIVFDGAAPRCGRMRESISSVRPGCRLGAKPTMTR